MKSNETNNSGTKTEGVKLGCCNHEDIQGCFEKISECFPGPNKASGFSDLQGNMMKTMMAMFCPTERSKANENQKVKQDDRGE